ncbi:AbiV family abortive infection protein [Microcoleus sp. FACHB-53]|nr:AbiV family abortive infection protein [Microcoleus sp. FACHB-53]
MIGEQHREHLEKYWRLSQRFFQEGDYALSTFFAISLIEEVGKVIILGNKKVSGKLDKKAFYKHQNKYIYAVYTTLLINSRVTRIYGENENRFAKWFREEELFKLRNKALYAEISPEGVLVPEQMIDSKDSFLLICIGGEILAEIQGTYTGTGASAWNRLIDEVDTFRESNSQYMM